MADEVAPGTDVVSIKRVAGAEAGVFRDGAVYLRTNGTVGLLYRQPLTGTPAVSIALPRTEWEYRPAIYYIRQYAYDLGDGHYIPTPEEFWGEGVPAADEGEYYYIVDNQDANKGHGNDLDFCDEDNPNWETCWISAASPPVPASFTRPNAS